jgi:hypothetical protein
MTDETGRSYRIYPLAYASMYQELDKAHCVVVTHDDDPAYQTLTIAATARYEQIQLRDDCARFDVYAYNGFAFTMIQPGSSVQQPFLVQCPVDLAFPTPLRFRQALRLAGVSIDQLTYHYPFDVQSLYDMTANLPVKREHAAFALARLTVSSRILFTFDTVEVKTMLP